MVAHKTNKMALDDFIFVGLSYSQGNDMGTLSMGDLRFAIIAAGR